VFTPFRLSSGDIPTDMRRTTRVKSSRAQLYAALSAFGRVIYFNGLFARAYQMHLASPWACRIRPERGVASIFQQEQLLRLSATRWTVLCTSGGFEHWKRAEMH
jgi:hypothetical protein